MRCKAAHLNADATLHSSLDATELDNLSTLQCISLVHPRHNKPTRFLHSATSIWEVQRIYQPPSSWIIQHGVQEGQWMEVDTAVAAHA